MFFTPWVLRIIIANVVFYFLSHGVPGVERALEFIPSEFLIRPWTAVTYTFLHADFTHILFNMLGLFFFGPRLELELGGRRFLQLYFLSGFMGAILSFIFSPDAAIIGASGAVFGVMMGFAYLWPREHIYIWGILPIQARYMVVLITIFSLVSIQSSVENGIAHFAHLGGFLGGYLYLVWTTRSLTAARKKRAAQVVNVDTGMAEKWKQISRERLHPVNREEYDRIRSKMDAVGIGSLTRAEIDFLNRFSDTEQPPANGGSS